MKTDDEATEGCRLLSMVCDVSSRLVVGNVPSIYPKLQFLLLVFFSIELLWFLLDSFRPTSASTFGGRTVLEVCGDLDERIGRNRIFKTLFLPQENTLSQFRPTTFDHSSCPFTCGCV
jgi:hypothetical protein